MKRGRKPKMAKKKADLRTPEALGTKDVRWDFSVFGYTGIDDPQIGKDIATFERRAKAFQKKFEGNLATKLGEAIRTYAGLMELRNKILVYVRLSYSQATDDEKRMALLRKVDEALSSAGQHLSFFALDVMDLSPKEIERQSAHESVVRHHLPWIRNVRRRIPFRLHREAEKILAICEPAGASFPATEFTQWRSALRLTFRGKSKTLEELLNMLGEEKNANTRADMLRTVNEGLKEQNFVRHSTGVLNHILTAARIDERTRGFAHPMHERNIDNQLSDECVDALHSANDRYIVPLGKRHHLLKAAILGVEKLRWSDRNAPLPFTDTAAISYKEASDMVLAAYRSFSPTLAKIIADAAERGWIDAPAHPEKAGGAFNYPAMLPGGTPAGFVLLNYLGGSRDVMMLAHELGHTVHGILAGEEQGVLMMHAPMAYAETASTFGEMTAFNMLAERLRQESKKKELLALIMGRIDDILGTTLRQICFSFFEQEAHNARSYLSSGEFSDIWMRVHEKRYGKNGEVFYYDDPPMDAMWSYVPHFHRPFYVYAYAFGELLTSALCARQSEYGDKFEEMYLSMLRAGNTKSAVELLRPFELNPEEAKFWKAGIDAGLGALVTEAERLAKELGYKVPA